MALAAALAIGALTLPPTNTAAADIQAQSADAKSRYTPTVTIARRDGRLQIKHVLDGAKIYNVRYRKTGVDRWTWNGQTARTTSTSTKTIDANADYDVQVKAFINGSWRQWSTFRNDAGTNPPTTPTPPTTTPTPPPTTVPPVPSKPVSQSDTPRVLIDTDLGGDPDDIQSLVRAIHYSDALDIEGIVSTEGIGAANAGLIREWIKRTDVNHLRSMGYTDLMTEKQLLSVVKSGTQDKKGPGNGRSTAGSKHIIQRAHAGSAQDPLWILAWGSLGTVAQALHDDPSIVSKIRIYSIGDYNSTSNLDARDYVLKVLRRNPNMWWIENGVLPRRSHSTFRGVWETGNQTGEWHRVTFLKKNIRGHGTTSNERFNSKLGDAFPVGNSPAAAVGSLKEGDSPSLLYLLSPEFGGVGNLDNPTKPSWGGQFRRADSDFPNYYIDRDCATPDDCKRTISKHRVDYLRHWKLRWDRYTVPAGR
jgi:hypothetical protein